MGQLDQVWRQIESVESRHQADNYTTCVQTVVLYGAEAWTLLKEDSRRLQEVHVDMPKAYMYPRY